MNSNEPCIIQTSFINNIGAFFNDELLLKNESNDFETFAATLYKQLDVKYPKFHKMDNLCKLGFLASEIALNNIDLHQKYSADKIGIHIINTNSSLDTDIKYQKLINQGIASPAVFVYTLPNIMIGEICIRHNIKGDNLLMVSDNYDIELQYNYINSLFKSNSIDVCICGFVDYTETAYEAFLIIVEKNNIESFLSYTPTHIEHLIKEKKSWN